MRSTTFRRLWTVRAGGGRDARGRTLGVITSASVRSAVVTLGGPDDPPNGRVRPLRRPAPGPRPRPLGLFAGDTPWAAAGTGPAATSLAVTIGPDGGPPRTTSHPATQLALKTVGFGE
ncbi:anti-sigma factor domain-containing protein [Streptomyces calvus]|uniref:anti-sigma factor domain-containing protein n=1 Tax=Streptomyces calvus TaxID=67282 RepID=UPI00372217E7